MHPLRVLLVVSLGIAAAIATAFGALLAKAGLSGTERTILAFAVFAAYLIPWAGAYLWAIRRASDLETLIDRTRSVVENNVTASITDSSYHGELDELARSIDAVRALLMEQRGALSEHRLAIDQIVGALGEGLLA